jgi:apolipoprotein N-acyltransferase
VLTTPLSEDAALALRLQERVDELGLPVVLGMVRAAKSEERGAYRNSVAWWSPGLGEQDAVDKVRAIPVLESGRDFPGRSVLTRIFNLPASTPKVVEADRPRPLRGRFTLAPALCFEILFPRLISQRRTADSLAIVNFADDSWVASETLDRQLITAAAFRAIEQRLTLIRVAHGGLSVVIDPFGREIASLPPDTDSDMSVGVSKSKPISFFERAAILALPILGWLSARALCAAIARRGWGLHAESRER